jgi:hypothetical protein
MTTGVDDRGKFGRIIDTLAASMGRKLSPEEAHAYYQGLSHYGLELLQKATNNLIDAYLPNKDGFHNVPTVSEILAEIKSVKAEKALKVIPEWCDVCNSTGLVLVDFKDRQPLAYRCECKNGDRQDRGIKPWAEVKSKYTPPDDVFPALLSIVTKEQVSMMAPGDVLEEGCEVSKMCETCNKPYSVRHDRRITGKDLKQIHSRPPECESCFIERGRKSGLWT